MMQKMEEEMKKMAEERAKLEELARQGKPRLEVIVDRRPVEAKAREAPAANAPKEDKVRTPPFASLDVCVLTWVLLGAR